MPPAPLAAASAAAAASVTTATATAPATSDELRRLRAQNEGLQRSVGALESRLRELEGARGRDPWLTALAFLLAALALLGVAVLWRRVQHGGKPTWWNPSALAPASEQEVAPASLRPAAAPAFQVSEMRDGVVDDDDDESRGPATTRAFAMTLPGEPIPDRASGAAGRGELSVEELFDLEQQADFFLALGQEEAAIDLLLGHARSQGAASPMPYLKLIDIYRRRGDHAGYEATRQQFNPRFNATIGDWDAGLSEGRPLDESADLVASLQGVWPQPAAAVQMLEDLLWHSDGPRSKVDLAAYRDLLFLYTIARDLHDRSDHPERVDVALPLLEGDSGSSHVALLMSSTIPMRVQEEHGRGLDRAIVPDIDLSAPPARAEPSSPAPDAPPGFTLGSDFIRIEEPPPDAGKP